MNIVEDLLRITLGIVATISQVLREIRLVSQGILPEDRTSESTLTAFRPLFVASLVGILYASFLSLLPREQDLKTPEITDYQLNQSSLICEKCRGLSTENTLTKTYAPRTPDIYSEKSRVSDVVCLPRRDNSVVTRTNIGFAVKYQCQLLSAAQASVKPVTTRYVLWEEIAGKEAAAWRKEPR